MSESMQRLEESGATIFQVHIKMNAQNDVYNFV
mgnify:CR=1 FL=1